MHFFKTLSNKVKAQYYDKIDRKGVTQMKLKELLQIWLNKYAKLTLKVRSYNGYENIIRLHTNPLLGDYDIQDITPAILQDYVIEKLKKVILSHISL